MGRAVVKVEHAYGWWKLCIRGPIKGDLQYAHHSAMFGVGEARIT